MPGAELSVNELLDAGCLVLTHSRQLAHALRLEYAQYAQRRGRQAWPTPQVMPWISWLRAQWVERRPQQPAGRAEQLLSTTQARVLWEQVIGQSEQAAYLLDIASTARTAALSWRRLHEYLIPLARLSSSASPEACAFHEWAEQFMLRCVQLRAIDEVRLLERAHAQQWLPPQSATFIGFDVLVPAAQRLIELWQSHGRFVVCSNAATVGEVRVLGAADARNELEMAARWSRALLKAGGATSIGIVMADLDARRREVQRVFEDVFAPGNASIGVAQMTVPIAVAAPEPLASHPSVDAAACCLPMLCGDADGALAGRLLRTPFIAAGLAENDARALADARLREEQRAHWDWAYLERWAAITGCAQLQIAAAKAATVARTLPARQLPSAWAEAFNALLVAVGWPGERTLSSAEYQTERKFHAALGELGTLDEVLGPLSVRAALTRLQTILQDTPFEPEAQPAAIHIVDPGATAGLHYDALWVMGLDAQRLPGAVSPDPLIPLELQQAAKMPEASAQQWLQLAQARLQRLTRSAATVVLSWPQTDGEAHLQASALLAEWPAMTGAQLHQVDARSRSRQLFDTRPMLERFFDEHAPHLEGSAAKGGARILELQSCCPFRAQAELRLAARPLSSVQFGMGARERGMLLHRVLEYLWRELESQQRLLESDPAQIELRVRELTLQHAARLLRAETPLRARLLDVEVDYTVRQILQLLAVERQRLPFTVRLAEQGSHVEIGGLNITLQLDRLDELQPAGQLLIDYKLGTGNQPGQWSDVRPGRPRRPQLPLYALASAARTQALAFVILAPGKVEFRGWSEVPTGTPGIEIYPPARSRKSGPPDWSALLQHWRATLTQLAEQFLAGHAAVDPLPRECVTCHLRSFCRVHEHAQLVQYDLDLDDE